MPVSKPTAKELNRTTEMLYCVFVEQYNKNRKDEVSIPSLERVEYAKKLMASWEKAAIRANAQWGVSR